MLGFLIAWLRDLISCRGFGLHSDGDLCNLEIGTFHWAMSSLEDAWTV